VSFVLGHLGDALRLAFAMFWQVLWPLALGFLLSAVIEALVSKQAVARLLGKDFNARRGHRCGVWRRVVIVLICRGGARAHAVS